MTSEYSDSIHPEEQCEDLQRERIKVYSQVLRDKFHSYEASVVRHLEGLKHDCLGQVQKFMDRRGISLVTRVVLVAWGVYEGELCLDSK